ncbi:MAG: hypothetical protein KDA92_12790 [Planctomycetales bacterium]|nr:hypothetical protein [Planctomycetales bacterium]
MSSHRTSTWFILFFWMASMTWLGWTKLRPAATLGQPPVQSEVLPLTVGKQPPVGWKIRLNGKPIGWVEQQIERLPDGQGNVESLLRIQKLRFNQIVSEGFGGLGALIAGGLTGGVADAPAIDLTIRNSMQFDYFGQLESFECIVTEDRWGECIRLQGIMREKELSLRAYLVMTPDETNPAREPVYTGDLPLPQERLVSDALSPSPRLANLRVGQHWTFEAYNPLTPTRPLQTISARVEDRRALRWGGDDMMTYHVVYQRSDDDGLSVERDLGELWVADDGTVMKQSAHWGQLNLEFELMAAGELETLGKPRLAGSDRFAAQNDDGSDKGLSP